MTGSHMGNFQLISRRRFALGASAGMAWLAGGLAAFGHSTNELQETLQKREKFFQAIDKPAADFSGTDAEGNVVTLKDLRDKAVVLFFVYTNCPDVCPLHAELIAKVQGLVNDAPGGERVQFVAVTTDPANDNAEIRRAYGPDHGLAPSNWVFLTLGADKNAETGALVAQYGHKFTPQETGYLLHGVVTHVIDKQGKWRANFHGLDFNPLNLVVFLNALVNEKENDGHTPASPGLWQRFRSWF